MPAETVASGEVLLSADGLYVSFFTQSGEVRAVNGVSLTIRRGEVLGIVGESGSGKTVTVNSFMRLLPKTGRVTSGSVRFEGRDVQAMNKRALNDLRGKEVSMIFQDPMTSLNPVFTIGSQIVETLKHHTGITSSAAKARAVDLLGMVGIPNPEKRFYQYPHEFSGGMRQRAMIAMALCCDPKLLIADEPTTALDVTIQAQILELMAGLREKINTAIILITHDLGIVSSICDRILVMYAGTVVEEGLVDDIFDYTAHPYTAGLLKCLPSLMDDERKPLVPIVGTPVDLLNLPAGCAFGARCPECRKICLRKKPPRVPVGPGHFAECWLRVPGGSEARV